jgi:predicted nucleic acid-binding protein
MILVLDASAAVRAATEPGNPRWAEPIALADLVLAPDLFAAEVANAFWKYARAGMLTRDAGEMGLRNALGLIDEFRPVHELAAEAFDLAFMQKRRVYDMIYLVLARRQSAVLITADKELAAISNRIGVRLG